MHRVGRRIEKQENLNIGNDLLEGGYHISN